MLELGVKMPDGKSMKLTGSIDKALPTEGVMKENYAAKIFPLPEKIEDLDKTLDNMVYKNIEVPKALNMKSKADFQKAIKLPPGKLGVLMDGFFDVKTAGDYKFIIHGADGIVLTVDGDKSVEQFKADGKSSGVKSMSQKMTAGRHTIKLQYYVVDKSQDNIYLQVAMMGPDTDGKAGIIPVYHYA